MHNGSKHAASGAILQHLGLKMVSADRRTDPRAYEMYVRAKAIIRARDWENSTRRGSS